MRRNVRKRCLLTIAILLLGTMFACQKEWEGQYEVWEEQCNDFASGNVLFLYPNFDEYSILETRQYAFPDAPDIVFQYLSKIDRYVDRYPVGDEQTDMVYLTGTCGPHAIFYEGDSLEKPGWHRYTIRLSMLGYFELRGQNQAFFVLIPFPIHLLPQTKGRYSVTLYEYNNTLSADFDSVADFAERFKAGVLDSEERTITYAYPDHNFSLLFVDQGDGTIRVIKEEITS